MTDEWSNWLVWDFVLSPDDERTDYKCGCVYARHPASDGLRVALAQCRKHGVPREPKPLEYKAP